MLSSKKLMKVVRKWHYTGAISPKSILLSVSMKSGDGDEDGDGDGYRKPDALNSGYFVFYTIDWKRFNVPITFLSSDIFLELFKMSEEEFGINSNGPILMPCDTTLMSYIVSLAHRGMSKNSENALRSIIISCRCSLAAPFSEQSIGQQVLVSG